MAKSAAIVAGGAGADRVAQDPGTPSAVLADGGTGDSGDDGSGERSWDDTGGVATPPQLVTASATSKAAILMCWGLSAIGASYE